MNLPVPLPTAALLLYLVSQGAYNPVATAPGSDRAPVYAQSGRRVKDRLPPAPPPAEKPIVFKLRGGRSGPPLGVLRG